MPVGRRLGDERAAARDALDEAAVGEALHRVPRGHPADRELPAQVGIRGQPLARAHRRDPRAERLLDVPVVRDPGDRPRHAAPARSAPCTAAPIAPAHVPSSAGTSVTSSIEVVVTRRAISARMGANRRSPAAATPPPRTIRSGDSTVIMLAIPIPRYRPTAARPAIARSLPARAARTASSAVAVPHAAAIWSARA